MSYEKDNSKTGKNKKTGAIILILIGLFCGILTVRSFTAGRAAARKELDDIVYVGQNGYDPENNGKIVIVCGELKLSEPAYDEELGLTIYAPRTMRTGQKMELKEWNMPVSEKNMDWKSAMNEMAIFLGKADVGEFHLDEEFLDQMLVFGSYECDEKMLEQAGLATFTDQKYGKEKFIGTRKMGKGIFEEGDVRYKYSVPKQKDGDMVTVIAIQDQTTLKYAKGATPNMLSGELDRAAALRECGMSSGGGSFFGIIITIVFLTLGIRSFLKKKSL